jgi:hypothetical protein
VESLIAVMSQANLRDVRQFEHHALNNQPFICQRRIIATILLFLYCTLIRARYLHDLPACPFMGQIGKMIMITGFRSQTQSTQTLPD